jgi:hypothetical protein
MMIHGKNLFPMQLVLTGSQGYFMDADGEIWSERARKGSLVKLAGSRTPSGRYVTLATNARFGQAYKLEQLQRQARAHADWTKHVLTLAQTATLSKVDLASALGLKGPVAAKVAPSIAAALKAAERHHAASVDAGIKARGWIIGTVNEGAITFGLNPAIHTVEQSVNDEIDRLAKLRPGVKFVKLQIQGAVTAGSVVWE